MPTHVAWIRKPLADALLRGRKRVESRFSRTRRPPFGCVRVGDRVWFREVGGGWIGVARVARVRQYERLTPSAIHALCRRYQHEIAADAKYWRSRRDCRFATFLWLTDLRPVRGAPAATRQYGGAWRTLAQK